MTPLFNSPCLHIWLTTSPPLYSMAIYPPRSQRHSLSHAHYCLHRGTAKVTLLAGGLTTGLSTTVGTNAPAYPSSLSFTTPSDACFDKDGNVVMTSYTGCYVTLSDGLTVCLFVCLSVYLSVCLSVYLSVRPPTSPHHLALNQPWPNSP